MSDDILCETCLERGRERVAEIVTDDLQMCRDCFNGKATCREETVGGSDQVRERSTRRYQEKHRQKTRKRMRRWRKENAEHIRRYHEEWRAKRARMEKESSGATPES